MTALSDKIHIKFENGDTISHERLVNVQARKYIPIVYGGESSGCFPLEYFDILLHGSYF